MTGIGEKKVKRIYQTLHTPFKKRKKNLPSSSSAYSVVPNSDERKTCEVDIDESEDGGNSHN